jgi:two-component system, cell cycle sensor histidine kinase and response regulator CckA
MSCELVPVSRVPIPDKGLTMKTKPKSTKQLLSELAELRQTLAELRKSESELKAAQAALRESEERYRTAIEHSNDGVTIVKGDQHVFVNRRFLDMFGYSDPGEVLGRDVFIPVHPDDRDKVLAINRGRQREQEVPSRYEFKGVRKDGSTIYMEVSATKIIYEGEPATLAYLRDVTERKRTEEELRQAHKMQAIGTLAGGIAHDFNNILAAMIGFCERAAKEIEERNPARRYVEQVKRAGMRGRDLVRQILTFSRKTPLKTQELHLVPLIEETIGLLRAGLPPTVRIETNIRTERDEICADLSQIQQVLFNLCTNAAHAMAEWKGTIEIIISSEFMEPGSPVLEPDMPPGAYVVLAVRDTGVGMTREIKERIFDPFFTTKPAGEGTGMGLAVVYGIVRTHRGAITVASEPGKGSVFSVYFPQAGTAAMLPGEGVRSAPGGKERILFVDDEELLIEMTVGLLEGLGYQVSAVMDCKEALNLFSENPEGFDLIIADQAMPYMTGSELAKEVMRVRPDIPVVLCTGYTEAFSEDEAKAIGVRELVLKPLTKKETAEMIRRVLDGESR